MTLTEDDEPTPTEIARGAGYHEGQRAAYIAMLRMAISGLDDHWKSDANAERWRIERVETLSALHRLYDDLTGDCWELGVDRMHLADLVERVRKAIPESAFGGAVGVD